MTLTIGSLFSGYLGLDLAVESVLDARTAWVSDIDEGARKILAHRAPDVPNLGDITRIDWAQVEPVDIITGGSPYQDLSHAGRRAGMTEGTRSNLWASMREAIATIRPRLVVWENVMGALSANATSALEHCAGCMGGAGHGGPVLRALGRVLGDLADLGFDAEWHGLRVSDLGGCHGRWRVFVMAWPTDSDIAGLQGHPDQARATQAGRHGHVESGTGGPSLTLLPTPRASDTNGAGAHGTGGADLRTAISLLPTPRATDGTKGGPNQRGSSGDLMLPSAVVQLLPTPVAQPSGNSPEVHLRKKPGREVVTDLAIVVENGLLATGGRLLPTPTTEPMTGNGHARNLGKEVQLLPTPRTENRQSEDRFGPNLGMVLGTTPGYTSRWGEYAAAIASHERLTGRPAPAPTEPGPKGKPRLSDAFCEWMMCLPDGWVTDCGITRTQALKALGNGVVPLQAAHALRLMLDRAGRAAA